MVPSGVGEVVTIVRDFTEQRRPRRAAGSPTSRRRCGAWRRSSPATRAPEEVFQTVTEEVCAAARHPLCRAALRFEDADDGDDRRQVRRAARATFMLGSVLRLEDGRRARPCCARARPRASSYRELPGRARGARCARSASARASACRSASAASPGVRWSPRCARGRRCPRRPSAACRRSPSSSRWRSRARTRATSSPRRGCASSRRATPSGAGSSATSTTAPSSGSSRSRSACGSPRAKIGDAPGGGCASCSASLAEDLTAALDGAARARAGASTPPCSPSAGLAPRSRCSPPARRCRSQLDVELSGAAARAGRGSRLLRRLGGARERRQARRRRRGAPSASRASTAARASRSRTTASAARDLDGGSGLRGLRDRVETLDGRLEVESLARTRHAAFCADLPVRMRADLLLQRRRGLDRLARPARRRLRGRARGCPRAPARCRRRSPAAARSTAAATSSSASSTGPEPAVDAALAVQRAFAAYAWPAGERVRVRIGLHAGDAEGGERRLRRDQRPSRGAHLPGRPRRPGARLGGGRRGDARRRAATSASSSSRDCAARSASSSSSPTICRPSSRRCATSASTTKACAP